MSALILQETFNHFESQSQKDFFSNVSVLANVLNTNVLDFSAHKVIMGDGSGEAFPRPYANLGGSEYAKLFTYGKCAVATAGDTFGIYISHDNSDYYLLTEIMPRKPYATSVWYHFSHMGHLPARYVRIGNLSSGTISNWDLHFSLQN
tara:strand:+ start:339 stop:782 length:444 start_codon:yes stop_codon:yes gene_type:complete